MYVEILEEAGYKHAMLGLSLSYYDRTQHITEWWTADKRHKAHQRALSLAFLGNGHNKFLESMQVWLFVQAPRCFWSEFDTYRIGITKNSSSTMHTLSRRMTTKADYEQCTHQLAIDTLNALIDSKADISTLKMNLPEGWLQERQICLSYMSLQSILKQREGHKLKQWSMFREQILSQAKYPEFLVKKENN